jgi:hypothetical protein
MRRRVTAAELGAPTFVDPLPVAAVAELQFEPESGYAVEPISPGTAVLRLFDNTVCAQSRSEAALDALVAATTDVKAVAGTRGEAAETVVHLRDLVGSAGSDLGSAR